MNEAHNLQAMQYEATPQSAETVDPTLMAALSIAQTSYAETAPKREKTPAELISAFAGIVEQMRLSESTDKEGPKIDQWALASTLQEIYRTDQDASAASRIDRAA